MRKILESLRSLVCFRNMAFLGLFFLAIFTFEGDFWWPKWVVIEALGIATIEYLVAKRYGWLVATCFAWPLIGSLVVFGPQTVDTSKTGPVTLAIEDITLKSSMAFILVAGSVLLLRPWQRREVTKVMSSLCFSDSLCVLYQWFIGAGKNERGGFIGNPSMNATFIAVTFSYLAFETEKIDYAFKKLSEIKKSDWISFGMDVTFVVVPVLAIFAANASIPVGTLAIVAFSYILCEKGKAALPLAFCFLLVVLICGFQFTEDFLANSGRFDIWRINLVWWWDHADLWTGIGNGEFYFFGPKTQEITQLPGHLWWIWCHNDWLQTLIEQGIIGLVLYISLFVTAVYKTFKSKLSADFAACIGYAGSSFFNFNAHLALPALLGVLIVARIFDKEQT